MTPDLEPIPTPRILLEHLLDNTRDLIEVWSYKRGTSARNDRLMTSLKLNAETARRLLEEHPRPQ